MNRALYHAGYNPDGNPENTLTKFSRLTQEILRSDDPRWPQLEAAVKRLIEEFSPAGEGP
jgi:hypothetical protein